MNIRHTLITLGLALSLLGSTSAFARPHLEHGCLSCEKSTATGAVPRMKTSSAAEHARHLPPANADKDGWPADMILG
jgi:hypothetical protein